MQGQLADVNVPFSLEEYRCFSIFTGDQLPITASTESLRALTLHLPPWRFMKGGSVVTHIISAACTIAHRLRTLHLSVHPPGAILSLERVCALLRQCVALRDLELDFQQTPISPESLASILDSLPHGGAMLKSLSLVLSFGRGPTLELPRQACQLLANEIYARCDGMRGLRALRVLSSPLDDEWHAEPIARALEPFRQVSRMRRYVFSTGIAARRR
ncbi:hypothetical protein AURDEDRAFT_176014 [Auricularia subglabra TFB-10046 SS5]|uniref:F-box domain-containing protein n=1 Tax=Auricularia subglabra (strain TFB-10046 / SS5) TaxID=717982 RepID=J0LDX7_AURST|nr:hypothetical protein AURDEDRAFT_176014 [Auricularia subglabra TFB-10046 SS5]